MVKLSKTEAQKEIKEFFENINQKNPKEIKKIKVLAMKYNIPLKNYRKKFCKKCFSPYKNSKIRIKGDKKITVCENCGHINRLKIKTS